MIQTRNRRDHCGHIRWSQSSIRPGDDSDLNAERTIRWEFLWSQSSIRPGDDSDNYTLYRVETKVVWSQSSIRPGDDSDLKRLHYSKSLSRKSRNPVFALEMIQTQMDVAKSQALDLRRNPVFALEMIQTQ